MPAAADDPSGPCTPSVAVRLKDVAAVGGMSVGTVSKALGTGEVSTDTRIRLRALAEEMGYRTRVRSRRPARTRAIGLLTDDPGARFSIPVLRGAADAVGAGGVSVLLAVSRGDAISRHHHLRSLLAQGVDGLISLAATTDDQPSLGGVGVPVVYAYGASGDPADCSIVPDEAAGAAMAVDHLLAVGRRRIAHISGPAEAAATERQLVAVDRVLAAEGLQMALPGPLLGAWTEQWGRAAIAMVLRAGEVDAVCCGSDTIARGVTDALRDQGLRIPQDVAVTGFDNWEVIATAARPPITSIDLGLERLGRSAARALMEAIAGSPRAGKQLQPARLVLRQSTVG